jgi:hypothetical protein
MEIFNSNLHPSQPNSGEQQEESPDTPQRSLTQINPPVAMQPNPLSLTVSHLPIQSETLTKQQTIQLQKEALDMPQRVSEALEWEILEYVSQCYCLTAEMLSRLLGYSYRYVQLGCRLLTEQGMLEAHHARKQTRFGVAPYVYSIGERGHNRLKQAGHPVPTRYRSLYERLHEGDPLAHTLAVNEFLINALILERTDPNITVSFVHELDLNANPLIIPLPDEKKPVRLSADLWLKIEFANPPDQYCFLVEVYLSKLSKNRWQKKVRAYLNSFAVYRERFGTTQLDGICVTEQNKLEFPRIDLSRLTPREEQRFAFLEKQKEQRFSQVVEWTRQEYLAHNITPNSEDAGIFLFSKTALPTLTPWELFYSPHWYTAVQDNSNPLILPTKEVQM